MNDFIKILLLISIIIFVCSGCNKKTIDLTSLEGDIVLSTIKKNETSTNKNSGWLGK